MRAFSLKTATVNQVVKNDVSQNSEVKVVKLKQ